VIQPGGVFSLRLTANLRYHCSIHPGMTASIVVAT
jgi:plastocyanin